MSAGTRVLILGYGNSGRQDDGLGPAVVAEIERLGWSHITAYENHQLNIEDAMDVAEHDVVWFVDAAKAGPEPYVVSEVAPASNIAFSSHVVRPEVILAIARQCYGRAPPAFMLGIRGYGFACGEELTPAATENLHAALRMLAERVGTGPPRASA